MEFARAAILIFRVAGVSCVRISEKFRFVCVRMSTFRNDHGFQVGSAVRGASQRRHLRVTVLIFWCLLLQERERENVSDWRQKTQKRMFFDARNTDFNVLWKLWCDGPVSNNDTHLAFGNPTLFFVMRAHHVSRSETSSRRFIDRR